MHKSMSDNINSSTRHKNGGLSVSRVGVCKRIGPRGDADGRVGFGVSFRVVASLCVRD